MSVTVPGFDTPAMTFQCERITEDELKSRVMLWMINAEYMPTDIALEAKYLGSTLHYVPVMTKQIKYAATYQAQIGTTVIRRQASQNGQAPKQEKSTDWRFVHDDVSGTTELSIFPFRTGNVPGLSAVNPVEFIKQCASLPRIPMDRVKEKFSISNESCDDLFSKKLDSYLMDKIRGMLSGDAQKNIKPNIKSQTVEKADCVHIPVWSVIFRYKSKDFAFIINGCNPTSVYGIPPQDIPKTQYAKNAYSPAIISLSITIAAFIIASSVDGKWIYYVGLAALIATFYLFQVGMRRAHTPIEADTSRMEALRSRLLQIFAKPEYSYDEKQQRAASLSVRNDTPANPPQHQSQPSLHRKKRRKKRRHLRIKRIILLCAALILVVAVICAAISTIKKHSSVKAEPAFASSSARKTEEPNVRPDEHHQKASEFTLENTLSQNSVPGELPNATYETMTIDEVKQEGQWDNYDSLSPRPNGIGFTADFDFQPEAQYLIRIDGAWYQGYDAASGARYIYLYYTELDAPSNVDWAWYQLDSSVRLTDYLSDAAESNSDTLSPIGTWVCIGYFDPLVWPDQPDYYQPIPEKYVQSVKDVLTLRIDSATLTQFMNGQESACFPWSMDGQTINVTLPAESEYYGYYLVDENTIHEFYADSAIYIYTRK